MLAQINSDKIVDSFYVQICLWTVGQHYKGNFIVQCWLRQIKTTLHRLLSSENSCCYYQVKMFLSIYVSICMPLGQHCRSNFLYNVAIDVFKQHWLDICNVVPSLSIQHCIGYFPHQSCLLAMDQHWTGKTLHAMLSKRLQTTLHRKNSWSMLF